MHSPPQSCCPPAPGLPESSHHRQAPAHRRALGHRLSSQGLEATPGEQTSRVQRAGEGGFCFQPGPDTKTELPLL